LVHFSGLEAPLSGKNFPLTHSSQLEDDEAPVTEEYLPAWQSVHIEDDAWEYVPAWQSAQSEGFEASVTAEYLPASHSAHAEDPDASLYLPEGQDSQLPAEPAIQAVLRYFPAGHQLQHLPAEPPPHPLLE